MSKPEDITEPEQPQTPAPSAAKPLSESMLAWEAKVIRNMTRMSTDEEYRKSIAKRLS